MKGNCNKMFWTIICILAIALVPGPEIGGKAMAQNGTPGDREMERDMERDMDRDTDRERDRERDRDRDWYGDPGRPVVELEEADVFIEWNSTDTDYGIQFFWDSEGFRSMTVRNEDDQIALDVKTSKNVREQGLTEGFFESVEAPEDEISRDEFFDRFPEGEYSFLGISIENEWLLGEDDLTHILPAPPENLSPVEGETVRNQGFTVSFSPVTQDTEGDPIDIILYEVVVEKLEDDPILQTFTVILPPDRTEVDVPAQFLEPETEYKLEVIAQEESGNRTITENGPFMTD